MDELRSVEPERKRSLIVKLRVPAAFAQTPVPVQWSPRQTDITGHLQQDASRLSAVESAPAQPKHSLVDSPQSLLVSFPISNIRQEPITSAASEDGTQMQDYHHDPEISPSEHASSHLDAPLHDATTTAGAALQESASETARSINCEEVVGHHSAKDPEAECIRVAKPRPAEEDAHSEPEAASLPPRSRASISIMDLLRPASEEPVSQDVPNQMVVPDAHVSSAGVASHDTQEPQTPTASNDPDAFHVASVSAADILPHHIDAVMQEPDGQADETAAAAAFAPHTPQTAKVILRLSPAGMAKLAAFTNSYQPASYYGRERNPRRKATKAFGEVKTPGAVAPMANPQKQPVKSKATAIVGRPRKRGAQGSSEPVATKRHKPNLSASSRRSSRGAGEAPIAFPEFKAGPAFDLDVSTGEPRPIRDVEGDSIYVQRMISVLEARSTSKTNDTAKEQSVTMKALLERATPAQDEDALFLSASEAMEQLGPGRFWNNVMVTAEQQPLPLQTIDQFLREFYEEEILVWIQDCSAKSSKQAPSIRQVPIKAVRERFAAGQPIHPKPWNLLELAAHHEDGTRPRFLNNEDCRLLTKLKIPTAADHTRRKTYPVGFKEVEKWALLAQAGALTLPHQDSHGYSTYITVNVGLVGFGWLSSPTPEKRAEWNKKTQRFIEGTWRYVVLKPGQTVYFPAGTVHFVFRLPAAGNSLSFGGHVLRCSNIVHWVRCLLEEVQSASVTNEDLTDSATGYLERVERFVLEAKKNGTMERWGGEDSIKEFLRLKAKFTAVKKQSTK